VTNATSEAARGKQRERQKRYRENNRDRLRERSKAYYYQAHDKRLASRSQTRQRYLDRELSYNREYQVLRRQLLRQQLFDVLGHACVRCGYDTDERALQIDHVHGYGFDDRQRFASLTAYYEHILSVGIDGGYQILCANCNRIKMVEEKENHWRYRREKQESERELLAVE